MSDETKREGQQTPDQAKPVELSNAALETVAGGRKAGETPQEFLVVRPEEAVITGATFPK